MGKLNYLKSYHFPRSIIAGYTFKPSNFDFNKNNKDWEEFEREFHIDRRYIILPLQEHTDVVLFDEIPISPSDGVFVSERGWGAGVLTADCIPLLVQVGNVAVGAIHAGWRGLFKEIVFKGLSLACEHYRVLPSEFRVSVGPGADVCCYTVKEDVAQLWRSKCVEVESKDGVMKLDLYRIVLSQIRKAGVKNVEVVRMCSICSGMFYTRRGGDEGRNLSFIIKR